MPLYEYECEQCANRFERIQKFSDPPVDKCPTCGGAVRKLLSSPAIQFKGSGWYITDYAKKGGETKPATASGDAKAGTESKAEAKSESKETKDTKESKPSAAKSE